MCVCLLSHLVVQEGIWGRTRVNKNGVRTLITAKVQPGYLKCTLQGRLPGCLFQFDNVSAQCTDGRTGVCVDIAVPINRSGIFATNICV